MILLASNFAISAVLCAVAVYSATRLTGIDIQPLDELKSNHSLLICTQDS